MSKLLNQVNLSMVWEMCWGVENFSLAKELIKVFVKLYENFSSFLCYQKFHYPENSSSHYSSKHFLNITKSKKNRKNKKKFSKSIFHGWARSPRSKRFGWCFFFFFSILIFLLFFITCSKFESKIAIKVGNFNIFIFLWGWVLVFGRQSSWRIDDGCYWV